MRAPIFVLAMLLPALAAAQTSSPPPFPPRPPSIADRATEIIGAQLGALVIENAKLRAQAEGLQAQISDLRVKVDALRKEGSKPEREMPPAESR